MGVRRKEVGTLVNNLPEPCQVGDRLAMATEVARLAPQAWCRDPEQDTETPRPERFTDVVGVDGLNKPGRLERVNRGLWTSTFLGEEQVSNWVHWCTSESFAGPDFRVWTLDVDPAARVWEIDDGDDLDAFMREYGAPSPYEVHHLGGRADGMFPYVDYEIVGVHLTEEGQWRTRGMSLDRPVNAWSLYGWDCESTLWLRWAFTDATSLGVVTVKEGDTP